MGALPGARYGGDDTVSILRQRPYIVSVLDFGAGKGTMGAFIKNQPEFDHIEWTNYDPGMPDYDVLPNKRFDLVITTDVLEHVEPEKLATVIETLGNLTGKVLYSNIACSLTGKLFAEGPYVGQDLHLIVEHPSWWREQFKSLPLQEYEYHHRERRRQGKLLERAMLVHERL